MPSPLLPKLFNRLPDLADLHAVPAEWHSHLGTDCFVGLPRAYFLNTREPAGSVPCKNESRSCRRHHRVEEVNEHLVAYCQRGQHCPPFKITTDERLAWRLDLPALFADIASTLTLNGPAECIAPACWRIGTATKRHVPIFFSFALTVPRHVQNVAFVAAQKHERPVFFVPTADAALQPVAESLRACGGRLGVLADFLELDRKGRLTATLELSERWPDLDREPERSTEKLPLSAGATWAQLVVTLLDNGKINISHTSGDPQRTYTRAELKFETQAGTATEDWTMLEVIADHGCIPIRPQSAGKRDDDAYNRVKGITAKLKRVLPLEGQAFKKSDTPLQGNRTRSQITGYWPFLKIRREADRKMFNLGNYPTDPDDLVGDDPRERDR
jgi:hypothetical protein